MYEPDANDTVKDLLSHLCTLNKRLSWKLSCIYTDSKNSSVMEIKIQQKNQYQNGGMNQLYRIAYNPSNGQVSQMKYRGEFYPKPGPIIDVLLDIINAESRVLIS